MQSSAEKIETPNKVINDASASGQRRAQLENYLYTVYQNNDYPREVKPLSSPKLPETVSPLLLFAIVAFLVFDAILSVSLMQVLGGPQPALDQLLVRTDLAGFFLVKSLVCAGFLYTVAIYRHYRSLRHITGKRLLTLAFGAYSLLLIYELRLLW